MFYFSTDICTLILSWSYHLSVIVFVFCIFCLLVFFPPVFLCSCAPSQACFPPHLQCFSFLIPALFLVLFPSRVTPHQLH